MTFVKQAACPICKKLEKSNRLRRLDWPKCGILVDNPVRVVRNSMGSVHLDKGFSSRTTSSFIEGYYSIMIVSRGKMDRMQAYSAHVPRTLNLSLMTPSSLTANSRYP